MCRDASGLALEAELELVELTLNKQERSLRVHQEEERYYAEQQTRLEQEIRAIHAEIGGLKQVLVTERQTRRNKDEYDAAAKEILRHSSRADLLRAIEEVEGEMERISEEQLEINRHIEKGALSGYAALQNIRGTRRTVDGDLKSLQLQ